MPISAADPLLDVAGLSTGYGKIGVLHGVDLTIGAGEVVALLGPNGAGKTTLLRAVSGLLPWSGSVRFGGRDLAGASPRETVKAGLAHVIEGHRVFTQLDRDRQSPARGLRPAARASAPRGSRKRWRCFPRSPRSATSARCAVRRPAADPRGGAGPGAAAEAADARRAVGRTVAGAGRSRAGRGQRLRECGTAVLLVEQLIEKALALADRVYALARGSIVLEAATSEADLPRRLEHAYMTGGA